MKKIKSFFNSLPNKEAKMSLIPNVFIFILAVAMFQTFAIGLTILTFSLIMQLALSKIFDEKLNWENNLTGNISNTLFNLTKILTILGYPYLIYVNFSDKLNPFGPLGLTITGGFIVASTIAFLLKDYKSNFYSSYPQELIRGSVAILTGFVLLAFCYLTFGTLLIIVPLAAIIIFYLLGCFSEINYCLKIKFGNIYLALVVIAVIFSFMTQYKFLPILGGIGAIIIIAWIFESITSNLYKKSAERKKIEKEKQEKQQKEQEKHNKIIDYKNFIEQLADNLKINNQKQPTPEDLIKISLAFEFIPNLILKTISINFLTSIELQSFLAISKIKKQIVWEKDFERVIDFYGELYIRNYNDEDLHLIILLFNDLGESLKECKDFIAYTRLKNLLKETRIPIENFK